jgi:VIT1/CCC1 family predicted Fe2+/Mn2+ transporter
VSILKPDEVDAIHQRLQQLPEPDTRARLSRTDLLGACGVFLLVFLSTFPVAMPFIFMSNVWPALRVSNAIAVALLFALGMIFGRLTGRRPWIMGLCMVVLGGLFVVLAISLGG